MLDELESIDLLTVRQEPARRVLLIDNTEEEAGAQLKAHLERLAVRLDYQHLPDREIWLAEPSKQVMPRQSLQAVVSWMSQVQV